MFTKKEKQILELQQELSETTDSKEKTSLEKRLQNATCALETQKAQLNNVSLLNEYEDDETEKLEHLKNMVQIILYHEIFKRRHSGRDSLLKF